MTLEALRCELQPGISLRSMSQDEFRPLFEHYYPLVFKDKAHLDLREILSDSERGHLKRLESHMGKPQCLQIGLFSGDSFVGWHIGDQKSREEFYMRNSGILPAFQGQGIYSAMMKYLLLAIKEEGFQVISSKHNATNNRVIIPKLKAGFIISGLEISDKFGTMVRLEYFTNPTRRAAMDYRCGFTPPDETLRRHLRL